MAHALYGHLIDAQLKVMLKDKTIDGATSTIKFPRKPLSCSTCLQSNGIASKVVANDVEHRKTPYPGQTMCLDNVGPVMIHDELGETSTLVTSTSCLTDTPAVALLPPSSRTKPRPHASRTPPFAARTDTACNQEARSPWTWTSGRT